MTKLVGCAGILFLALALALAAGSADAEKRDVIGDADKICTLSPTDTNLADACLLVWKTNGQQNTTSAPGCEDLDNGDNGFVVYLLRNCDKNEEALLRKASSAVLSLSDFVNKGKEDQAATAAGYLCTYASSYMTLQGAGKLVAIPAIPASPEVDLAADAQNIVARLGFSCP